MCWAHYNNKLHHYVLQQQTEVERDR
eukprot:UN11943